MFSCLLVNPHQSLGNWRTTVIHAYFPYTPMCVCVYTCIIEATNGQFGISLSLSLSGTLPRIVSYIIWNSIEHFCHVIDTFVLETKQEKQIYPHHHLVMDSESESGWGWGWGWGRGSCRGSGWARRGVIRALWKYQRYRKLATERP